MKRLGLVAPALRNVLISLVAIVLALACASLLLMAGGISPLQAYRAMVDAAFGSPFAVGVTIGKTVPRLLPALGIALALRAGLWNIGAEGQLYMGATAAAAVALFMPDLGFPAAAALAMLGAMLGGALWGLIPGALRAYRGVSEVIISLMLVYVAVEFTNYLVEGPWLVPNSTFPATAMFASSFRLPIIWEGTLVNGGVILALIASVVLGLLVSRTTFGLWLRAIGSNQRATEVLGLPVKHMVMAAMAASGAFAGLGGAIEVLGTRGRLAESFSPGYGFQAIAIALLGRLDPLGIVGAAFVFGALEAGSAGLQVSSANISSAIAPVIEGLAVTFLLVGLGMDERLARRRRTLRALTREQGGEQTAAA